MDYDNNPIPEPTNDYVSLDAGSYECVLDDIKTLELNEFEGDGVYTGLLYKFKDLNSVEEAFITKICRASMSKKSNNFKLVAQLSGGAIPQEKLENNDVFWKYITSFVGDHFQVQNTPSDDGKYNNVNGVMPIKTKDSSDIPF